MDQIVRSLCIFLEQLVMYKVILHIESLNLRVKGGTSVQILIKKQDQYFINSQKSIIQNGYTSLDLIIQFYVQTKSPSFNIQILIESNGVSKLAGLCDLNLFDWDEYVGHNTTSRLDKSPDSQALISYFFLYFKTNQPFYGKKLVSLQCMEAYNHTFISEQFRTKNSVLMEENSRLNKQISDLKQRNEELTLGNSQLQGHFMEKKEKYKQTIGQKDQKIEQSRREIQGQKITINRMQNIIKQYKNREKEMKEIYDRKNGIKGQALKQKEEQRSMQSQQNRIQQNGIQQKK